MIKPYKVWLNQLRIRDELNKLTAYTLIKPQLHDWEDNDYIFTKVINSIKYTVKIASTAHMIMLIAEKINNQKIYRYIKYVSFHSMHDININAFVNKDKYWQYYYK